jgi:hypothetical protein
MQFKLPLDLSRPYDPQPDYAGNIWFGVGVLYPDVSMITTLGAYYLDMDAITSRRAIRNRPTREAAR